MADGAQEGKEKAARLINDLQDISFSKIGLIVVGTWLAIALAHRVLPFWQKKAPAGRACTCWVPCPSSGCCC